MNEQLEQQVSKVIEKALEVAESTGNFVIEQAPLLLQEFYMWHIVKFSIWILIAISFWLISNKFLKSFGKKESFETDSYPGFSWSKKIQAIEYNGRFFYHNDTVTGIKFFKYFIGLLCFGIIFNSIYKIVFIIVAPKFYLLDYFIL